MKKPPVFPKLNQREMATFLGLQPARLEWATHEGIVKRDGNCYRPEIVTPQWLNYVRRQSSKKEGRSEFERQRARLTRAKAETVERRLAVLDGSLIGTDDIIETAKTVCFRIKSKLQAALPRIARACFHAPIIAEALRKARSEFDLVISELSALENVGTTQFEVVKDENGAERSAAVRSKKKRVS